MTTSRLGTASVPHGLILKLVFSPAVDLCGVRLACLIITMTNWIEQNVPYADQVSAR